MKNQICKSQCVLLGYACICMKLKPKIYTNRTTTIVSLTRKVNEKILTKKDVLTKLIDMSHKNIEDLYKILQYNESIGIRFYRITSNLMPHINNPRLADLIGDNLIKQYKPELFASQFKKIGKYAKENGHRLTMHPDQFAQLGSLNKKVVKQTIKDLTTHAKIFSLMGLTPQDNSVMIIHGGGVYKDKIATLKRIKQNFNKLPKYVSQYIVLENDEWSYSVNDLLPLCEELNIPLCVDFFHHYIFEEGKKLNENLIKRAINIFRLRKIKPKFHWSSQAKNKRLGSHSNCVIGKDCCESEVLYYAKKYCADIMLECKDKDLCVLKVYKKCFNKVKINGKILWLLDKT